MLSRFFFVNLLFFCSGILTYGQVKIGDDVTTIDDASILELESTSKVLVLTRVTNTQMLSIASLPGGMVFNTDTGCVHSYNGTNWVSLCDGGSKSISFVDNNDGTFTIINPDGSTYTSSDLTGPQGEKGDTGDTGVQGEPGIDGTNAALELQQIVILASTGQTEFTTPQPIDDDNKIEVYRNGIRIDFTTLDANTIQLENNITCYQNDRIRIVQIL